ncbi:MAG: hypothetical protein A2Y28_00730 [Chlamydiae bacterium GWC2_50_10]|nr:MAG: hypothetical protein A2Z85_04430 [Chlamydiae bacterium GWA2_50_15]OGN54180.1 MAG: hypothetical protein A2Y28_00730 [Chlamydiae bacterium GWC2_50_10]OGN59053.1 MAG: hypothetical protein A3D18_02085 [Chlamydiae bacterium RIFCSPHIGHO2_02_FULL_49_29]OGN64574.1 MAG: hypothetical protein A3E26_05695 [Chlamydiae bacterium RIFCSPHIGHO2_12_FULL_49_32]OGN71087.1 MAG: hypothetical protein A3I15_05415 [Chlamydiae bacterium RIFCSPLOWO2_02_FULL_49_12]OGN73390.1 MAG: hypothetical protein A3G30_02810 
MRRIFFFLIFVGAAGGLFAAQEILSELKGILLMPGERMLYPFGTPEMRGIHLKDMDVPGGIEHLRRELEPRFIGQPLTQEGLAEIKRALILYYRRHDRPVVAVEVPEQEITNGVLQLIVIEGRIGKIICKNNRWFSDSLLLGYVQLRPGQAITADTLLTDVAWMNRNPFRKTDLIFTPGEDEGVTDIELITKDRFPFRPYLGGDNTGNGTTGQARWFGGFNWGNAFGCDQILSYQATLSSNINLFQAHSVHYTAPLPWRHLFLLFGGYAKIEPELTGFSSSGRSWQVSPRYTIPFNPLYRSFLQESSFGFDFKNTNNNFLFVEERELMAFGGEVNLSQFYGSYSLGKELKKHRLTLSLELYGSPGRLFSHQKDSDFESLRYRAKNRYVYGRLTAGDIITLPKKLSASLLGRLQLANGNLLPSEQFGLGGYDTVRGYDEREINADRALCLNGELRSMPLPFLKLFGFRKLDEELIFLAFLDFGLGNNVHLLPEESRFQTLLGAGPGLRYRIGKNLSIRADLGFKLHENQFSTSAPMRWHVGGMISF